MVLAKSKITSIEEALLNISEGIRANAKAPNIKKYTPHEKQYIFHSSSKKKKLYIGGNRSGKTTGGVCEDIWRATCTHPFRPDLNELGPNRGRVIAVDFVNGVEKIIFPQFKQWIYPSALRGGSWETAYDRFLRTLHFSNGSTIEFMSYDQDLDKFAGTSRHWVHFDEEPPKSIYVENMARLIDTDGDFWITMTPVEGMTWIFDELYENNIDNPDGSVEVIEVHMLENPFLSKDAVQSFIDSIDEDERQARLQGKFVQQGGRIYKEFDPTPGSLWVPDEEIDHPKQRFKDWYWICGLDHGLNNPTAVLWAAVSKHGEIYIFDEYYVRDKSLEENANAIHAINRKHGRDPDIYIADPSIQNRNAITMTSIHEEYARRGLPFALGNNDVKAGIVRVKGYMTPRPVGVRGPNKDKKEPLLKILPRCQKLRWELKRYRWKVYANKKLQYENNPFDEPHKRDDHACDALRYIIMTRPDMVAESDSFADRVTEAAEAVGSQFNFTTASSAFSEMADPHDLIGSSWQPGNSIPRGDTSWEFDEHMGGIY